MATASVIPPTPISAITPATVPVRSLKPAAPVPAPLAKDPASPPAKQSPPPVAPLIKATAKPAAPKPAVVAAPKPVAVPLKALPKPAPKAVAVPVAAASSSSSIPVASGSKKEKKACDRCGELGLPDTLVKWGIKVAELEGKTEAGLCCYNCTLKVQAAKNKASGVTKSKPEKAKGICDFCKRDKFTLENLQEWGAKYAVLKSLDPSATLACYNCYHSAEAKVNKPASSSGSKTKEKSECPHCPERGEVHNLSTLIEHGKSLAQLQGLPEDEAGLCCYNCKRKLTKGSNPKSPASKQARGKCPVEGCNREIAALRLKANGGICGFCKRKANAAPKQAACKNPACAKVLSTRTIKSNGGFCGPCRDQVKAGRLVFVEDTTAEAAEEGGEINEEAIEVPHEEEQVPEEAQGEEEQAQEEQVEA